MRTCPNCHQQHISVAIGLWRQRCPACGALVAPKFGIFAVIVPLVLVEVLVKHQGSNLQQLYRSIVVIVPAVIALTLALRAWAPLQVASKGWERQRYTRRERIAVVGLWALLLGVLAVASFWPHG